LVEILSIKWLSYTDEIFLSVKLLNIAVTSYSETNFYGMIQLLLFFFGFGDGVAGVFGLVGVLKHNRSSQ
jgi:hypothetical protein